MSSQLQFFREEGSVYLYILDTETNSLRIARLIHTEPKPALKLKIDGAVRKDTPKAKTGINLHNTAEKIRKLEKETQKPDRKPRVEITDEIKKQIKQMKKDGLTSKQVAEKLGVSLVSVNRHFMPHTSAQIY